MARKRLLTTIAATALGVSLLGACSTDSLAEFGLERAFEANGEDVDFDFNDGGFNLSTEEGEVSFNFDGENGGIFFEGEDGEGSIAFDDQGNIVFDTDDGSGTVSVSEDGVVVTDENGEEQAVISIDGETGAQTFTNEDGGTVTTSQAVPADWPVYIGVPQTLDAAQSAFTTGDFGDGWSFGGTITYDPAEDFPGAVTQRLEAAGFAPVGVNTPGLGQWEGQGQYVTITWQPGSVFIFASPVG